MRRTTALVAAVLFCLLTALVPTSAVGATGATGARAAQAPSVQVRSATVVAKGAAVEVNYLVLCPKADYLTALATNVRQETTRGVATGGDTLEVICSGRPQRITNLVTARGSGVGFRHRAPLSVSTELQNCNDESPECFDLRLTRTLDSLRKGFHPESNREVNARLRLLSARLTDARSTVRATYALRCPAGNQAFLQSAVTQSTSRRAKIIGAGAVTDFECTGKREVHSLLLEQQDGLQFHRRAAVLVAEVSDCNEPVGCFQGLDTSVRRLHLVRQGTRRHH